MTTSAEKPTEKIQVAIIGAGASGLVMGHQLMTDSRRFSVTLFEQTPSIGGTWVYTERIGLDQYGLPVHSSMYKNLR